MPTQDGSLHARSSPHEAGASSLSREESRLVRGHAADTLRGLDRRARDETRVAFPEKVTAFREGMAVHGRSAQALSRFAALRVQRIVYARNEANYCSR